MKVIFFGPPGSGKGTQADRVSDHFDLVHLSSGTLFREEVRKGTELGNRIRKIIGTGYFVSDEITNEEIFSRIAGIDRFLLDGYPRNVFQAESLDKFLDDGGNHLTGAIKLLVPDEEVIRRLSGRLNCSDCGRITGGGKDSCPVCGGPLTMRQDDRPEVIRQRLFNYHNSTRPLVKYYGNRMKKIDGIGLIPEVTVRIVEAISEWR